MMRTIAIASEKGGVGKTTIAINLSAALAKEGRRVLTVDMDAQGYCAVAVAVPDEKIEHSVLDVLIECPTAETIDFSRITWQITPNLDLAPSCRAMSDLERAPWADGDDFAPLTRALKHAAHRYDMCVIDCPAFSGVLTRYALDAADEVIVPVETAYFSLHALARQIETFLQWTRSGDQPLRVRALANQYDVRTKAAREILAELRRVHGELMFDSVINFNTKLKESASYGQPISEFAAGSMGARDFQALARELLAHQPAEPDRDTVVAAFADRLARDAGRVLATSIPVVKPTTSRPRPARSGALEPAVGGTRAASVFPASAPVASESAPATNHAGIDDRLATIYGVRQTPEGVVFRTRSPQARVVQLAGDFNDWMPHTTPMRRLDASGAFEATLKLPPGRYRYRLVIDGRWAYDRDNPCAETSEHGEVNSVVDIE